MSFEYVEEEMSLKYKGEVYKFRQPSAYEQKEISKTFRLADENTDAVDLYIDFFKLLGLPSEVLLGMSLQGLLDLFSYAVGAKKN